MQKKLMYEFLYENKKPSYSFYKFLILSIDKYENDILDIFKEIIGEIEEIRIEDKIVLFYFNHLEYSLKSIVKSINIDFYNSVKVFESGKLSFDNKDDFFLLFDLYKKNKISNMSYTCNKDMMNLILNKYPNDTKRIKRILLNKVAKDESLQELILDFFDNDLNVSQTAKNTYMHRNTINYKLEQIKEETGLDIRRFKEAVIMYLFLKCED